MGHFEGDPDRYRNDDDRDATRRKDALAGLRAVLVGGGRARDVELDAMGEEIERSVSDAVEFAKASPFPDPAEVDRYVYPEPLARVEGS
jgi:pyruvate dehydrogenase E1 component alpha subunit